MRCFQLLPDRVSLKNMTGKSHIAANGAIFFALSADPIIGTGVIIAARLPDQAEKFMPWVRHRTLTHHLYFWTTMALFFFLFPLGDIFPRVDPLIFHFAAGVFTGGALHVFMDMFSKSGVPIFPGKTWGARWYTTGSYSEYLFLGGLLLACAAVFLVRNPGYLPETGQILDFFKK